MSLQWEKTVESLLAGDHVPHDKVSNLNKTLKSLQKSHPRDPNIQRIQEALSMRETSKKVNEWEKILNKLESDQYVDWGQRRILTKKAKRLRDTNEHPELLRRVDNALDRWSSEHNAQTSPAPGRNNSARGADKDDVVGGSARKRKTFDFDKEFLTDSEDDSTPTQVSRYHPPITPVYRHEEFPFTADDNITDNPPPLFDGLLQSIDALHLRVKTLERSFFY